MEALRKIWNRGHRRYTDLLSDYIDGRVTERDQARLEEHLQACAECRNELESLRVAISLLRRVPMVEAPRSFKLAEAPVREPARPVFMWAMQASTALAVVAFTILVAGDASGLFGNGADQTAGLRTTTAQETSATDVPPSVEPTPVPAEMAAQTAPATDSAQMAAPAPAPEPGASGVAESIAVTEESEDVDVADDEAVSERVDVDESGETEEFTSPAQPTSERLATVGDDAADDGDGVVLGLEIGFGALAGALVLATVLITIRRRRVVS